MNTKHYLKEILALMDWMANMVENKEARIEMKDAIQRLQDELRSEK